MGRSGPPYDPQATPRALPRSRIGRVAQRHTARGLQSRAVQGLLRGSVRSAMSTSRAAKLGRPGSDGWSTSCCVRRELVCRVAFHSVGRPARRAGVPSCLIDSNPRTSSGLSRCALSNADCCYQRKDLWTEMWGPGRRSVVDIVGSMYAAYDFFDRGDAWVYRLPRIGRAPRGDRSVGARATDKKPG
jgi:hypothetical protein